MTKVKSERIDLFFIVVVFYKLIVTPKLKLRELDSMPAELDELSRKIMQMEIEEAALKKDDDRLTQAHLAEVQKELAEYGDTGMSVMEMSHRSAM